MNKVLAEIIAGVIPHKMTRNRWRGILRYGLFKALRLKYRLKHNHTPPQYYLAVCAIAKNEGPYFKEWIDWHRSQGVEKFYVYDNELIVNVTVTLEPKNYIEVYGKILGYDAKQKSIQLEGQIIKHLPKKK